MGNLNRFVGRLVWLFLIQACIFTGVSGAEPPSEKEPLRVELVDAGQEPRAPIRFTPEKGAKQSIVMAMDMQQRMTVAGNQMPSPKLPVQEITIATEVVNVSESGDIEFSYEYTDWKVLEGEGVQEQVRTAIQASMAPMIGARGKQTLSNRCLPIDSSIKIPEGLAPQIRTMVEGMSQSMEQMGSPVPEEAVGVGGKWKVIAKITANGLTVEQTSLYELLSVEEGVYKLKVTIDQKAAEQDVNSPALPPGAKMKLFGLTSSGLGMVELKTTEMLPRAKIKLNSNAAMQLEVGGQTQPMTIATDLTMSFREAEEEGTTE